MSVPTTTETDYAVVLRPIAAIGRGRIAPDWDQISAKEALAIWRLARELNDLPDDGPANREVEVGG